jgi:hypothetical protein
MAAAAARLRTPRERSGFIVCPRDERGRVVAINALARFADKCEFDPTTGCVLWRGGTTSGRGNTASYGSFWYDGRRWFAHRWAAVHIHRLAVNDMQVGHCCPAGPNTLCVQHLEPQTQLDNLAEQAGRMAARRLEQSADERQHWLFVSLGIREPAPALIADPDAIPFHQPPGWLLPYLRPRPGENGDGCPF